MSLNMNTTNSCDFDWFNEHDEKTLEIINVDVVCEEPNPLEQNNTNTLSNMMHISEYDNDNDDDDDDECSENIKTTIVEDILKKNPFDMSSIDVIQCECHIAYYVQILMEGSNGNNKIKSIKTHDNDLTFDKMQSIAEYLSWISSASEILAKKINQDILIYKSDQKPSIVRSSYNFCTQYTRCKNFYSKNETPSCKEHHYVHSLLKYDIDSVVQFLNHIIENKISMTREELNNMYLSIKTICFVTRHMQKEISYIDYITKNKSEIFHRNNPVDMFKKKIIKKTWLENDRNFQNDRYMKKEDTRTRKEDTRKGSNNNFLEKRNKNIIQTKTNNAYGFKKTETVKINKPKDFTNNRFSILSNY